MLKLVDLYKHYRVGGGEPVRAVDGVSMSIAAGEMVALYGPSGSGKTTLIKLVAAIERPDSGMVRVEGQDISALSERECDEYRLTRLGYIVQAQNPIPGARAIEIASLKLLMANAREAQKKIEPLLQRLGLGERLYHRTEELSMGELQRVMIAMALASKPRLILADEPTGTLDTQRTKEVLELLRELCVELAAAVLLVSHDPHAAAYADRAHELRDGRLHDYAPAEVFVPADSLAQR